jgi:two-component system phosphate regulon response regulator PhoB
MPSERVLVVDDDVLIRTMVADAFAAGGYRVTSAPDGEEALARLKEEVPEAIVMDKIMPNVGAARFMQRWRELGMNARPVLVIYSSAYHGEPIREQADEHFALRVHVSKETRPPDLVPLVATLLRRVRRGEAARGGARGEGGEPG